MALSEELSILESCVSEQSGGGRYLSQSCEDGTRKKVEYHLRKGGDLWRNGTCATLNAAQI